jgi:hypothetical protein
MVYNSARSADHSATIALLLPTTLWDTLKDCTNKLQEICDVIPQDEMERISEVTKLSMSHWQCSPRSMFEILSHRMTVGLLSNGTWELVMDVAGPELERWAKVRALASKMRRGITALDPFSIERYCAHGISLEEIDLLEC